jgi:hypothetical protein
MFNPVSFYLVLSKINTILRNVAHNYPEYRDECVEAQKLLRIEIGKIVDTEREVYNVVKEQIIRNN